MFTKNMKVILKYISAFFKWIAISTLTGAICGVTGALFHLSIDHVTQIRSCNPWILYLLPVGGIIIVFLYKMTKMEENGGTNNIINSVKDKERVPFKLAPLIFISTVITHLFGGSSGREGAALQLGGSIGEQTAKLFKQEKSNRNIVVMCGMSGLFAALFGTPATATVFAMEVVSVGIMHYSGFVPCIISSLTAFGIASLFGISPVQFAVTDMPKYEVIMFCRVAVLAVACAGVSILFCICMKKTSVYLKRILKNAYLRIVIGATAVILLTLIVGTYKYNGAGMETVKAAIAGNAEWYDFILKIIFTAVTIGSGFKGGEIVPTFFVGAAFGCFAGGILEISSGFAASLGLVALFCGVVNCPLASLLLSIELFGGGGILYYALAVGISYMLSGYFGLYSSQNIVYSKLKAEFINKTAD